MGSGRIVGAVGLVGVVSWIKVPRRRTPGGRRVLVGCWR